MNNFRTIALILTHNRSELLKRCLIKLKQQSEPLDEILVIDNGSTDNTQEVLKELKISSIKQENLGSAGGYNTGLNYAIKSGFDNAWLMDDDGYPDKKAFEILNKSFTEKMSCICSVVINEFDQSKLVFPYPILNRNGIPKIGFNKPSISLLSKLEKISKNNLYPWSHFFNGALVSLDAVKKIGNLNPEYYMYGDEVDFLFRLREVGEICTNIKAFHFHPEINKRPLNKIRIFYFIRNSIINYRKYYDNKTLRCTIGIFYLLFKIYQKNNNFKIIFSLLVGKDKSIFYKSLYQGMKNQLGKFKE